ncbi:MAG: DUF111 family protein, partial [Planctomycetia bacterium]|nr:DUF111 family protein [Planctomycetia bacterium]
MKILRFDSVGGASGDMILGALVGLGADLDMVEAELKKLIPDYFRFRRSIKESHGSSGVYLTVELQADKDGESACCDAQTTNETEQSEHCCRHGHAHTHKHEHNHDHEHEHHHDHDHGPDCTCG